MKRLVVFFPGFEPLAPAVHHNRYAREVKRFETAWNLRSDIGQLVHEGGAFYRWQAALEGPNWRSEADIHLLRWDDLIAAYDGRPLYQKLLAYGRAMVDLVISGTLFAYGKAHWRYAIFALYPLVLLFVFASFAVLIVSLMPLPLMARAALGIALFYSLLALLGPRWHVPYMLSDWAYAVDALHDKNANHNERINAFAEKLLTLPLASYDEVVLVGHSLGAAMMVQSLALALEKKPDFIISAPPFAMIGLGSSVLKLALHPKAKAMRGALWRVGQDSRLTWVDYDSHLDFISFYKADLCRLTGLALPHPPRRRSIRLSRMLSAATWKRFRLNYLRLHRQYVMGNECRYYYDYHMMTAGPLPIAEMHASEAWPGRFNEAGALDRDG